MIKITGAVIIIAVSLCLGFSLSDSIKKRISAIGSLAGFVDYVSNNIMLYKTPLEEIYAAVSDEFLIKSGFKDRLDAGVYTAAMEAGLITGDEEKEIIKEFSEKIGGGVAEDMVKLCTYTSSRLRAIGETLHRDYPDKRRVYHTVSFLVGASAVIILF